MNDPITFTPEQLISLIVWICGAIVSISAAITIIIKVINKAKEPERNQNERITVLESKVAKYEKYFDNDNKRLVELEKGNIVTQQALLALLSHAINGNDLDSLKEAKTKLERYLVNKGGTNNETG